MRDAGRTFSFRRSVAMAATLALHGAALLLLFRPLPPAPGVAVPTPAMEALPAWVAVDLGGRGEPPAPPVPAGAAARAAGRSASRPPAARRERAPSLPERAALAETAEADGAARPPVLAGPLPVHDDAARPRLPYEPLFAGAPKEAAGGFRTPGDGSEDDVFYRPLALEPRRTRFAKAWRGDRTLLDEWLGGLVEATSGRVSIPLNPKFNLVCRGSLAGLGGDCRIERNGGTGVVVERPPPAPWERSNRVQCDELRDGLARASEEDEVLRFLERLSALCTVNGEARREAGLPVGG
jgi:hypothetical protein